MKHSIPVVIEELINAHGIRLVVAGLARALEEKACGYGSETVHAEALNRLAHDVDGLLERWLP